MLDWLRTADAGWYDLERRPDFRGWTDDYSTILPLLAF